MLFVSSAGFDPAPYVGTLAPSVGQEVRPVHCVGRVHFASPLGHERATSDGRITYHHHGGPLASGDAHLPPAIG